MIKFEVRAVAQEHVSQKTGKPYKLQEGWAEVVSPQGQALAYPQRFEFFVPMRDQGLMPGAYILTPASIQIDDGRLVVNPRLAQPVPVVRTQPKAA